MKDFIWNYRNDICKKKILFARYNPKYFQNAIYIIEMKDSALLLHVPYNKSLLYYVFIVK